MTRTCRLLAGMLAVYGMEGCSGTTYPDEWGRPCGVDADSGDSGTCSEPFECVYRTDYTSAESGESIYQCSIACESDADCSASFGGQRTPTCMQSGYCANDKRSL